MTDVFRFEEESHTYWLGDRQLPGISAILRGSGLVGEDRFSKEEDRIRGKAIHLAIKYLNENCLDWDSVDPYIKGWVEAYRDFKSSTGFIPGSVEVPVYHPAFLFAGTPDVAGIFPGDPSPVVVEIKTGILNEEAVRLQLAGQAILLDHKFQCSHDRYCLQVKQDRTYKLHPQFKDPRDIKTFLAGLTVYNWKKTHGGIHD